MPQVMGFVPQDDLMYTDLTVEELLLFSARMRLPAAASGADHRRHVERAINVRVADVMSGVFSRVWVGPTRGQGLCNDFS